MRKRRRVTGRFYIFLAILLAIAFLIIRPYLNFGDGTAVIMTANSSFSKTMDCVIIRDESVVSAESAARVEYLTPENAVIARQVQDRKLGGTPLGSAPTFVGEQRGNPKYNDSFFSTIIRFGWRLFDNSDAAGMGCPKW